MDEYVVLPYSLVMRSLFSILLAVTCPLAAAPADANDGCHPVDCERPVSLVQKTLCQREDLKQIDRSIAQDCEAVAKLYSGDDLAVFVEGQKNWLTERNDCNNKPTASRYEGGISSCLKSRMDDRAALLRRLLAAPASIESTVASYTFVRPWYVKKFASRFEGKQVQVLGSVDLAACSRRHAKSLTGKLIENAVEIEIRFKSLSGQDVSFICQKHPYSWWLGTVKLDQGRPYLYATEILGSQLP